MPKIDAQVVCRQKSFPVAAQADAVDVVGVRITVHLAALRRHHHFCAGDLRKCKTDM